VFEVLLYGNKRLGKRAFFRPGIERKVNHGLPRHLSAVLMAATNLRREIEQSKHSSVLLNHDFAVESELLKLYAKHRNRAGQIPDRWFRIPQVGFGIRASLKAPGHNQLDVTEPPPFVDSRVPHP
jgi:hypothetical protein